MESLRESPESGVQFGSPVHGVRVSITNVASGDLLATMGMDFAPDIAPSYKAVEDTIQAAASAKVGGEVTVDPGLVEQINALSTQGIGAQLLAEMALLDPTVEPDESPVEVSEADSLLADPPEEELVGETPVLVDPLLVEQIYEISEKEDVVPILARMALLDTVAEVDEIPATAANSETEVVQATGLQTEVLDLEEADGFLLADILEMRRVYQAILAAKRLGERDVQPVVVAVALDAAQ